MIEEKQTRKKVLHALSGIGVFNLRFDVSKFFEDIGSEPVVAVGELRNAVEMGGFCIARYALTERKPRWKQVIIRHNGRFYRRYESGERVNIDADAMSPQERCFKVRGTASHERVKDHVPLV